MKIEDYAIIGDFQTAALVGRNCSIDWLCLPRFDSGACFASLLGDEGNGRWIISPKAEVIKIDRRYRDDSLILETDMQTEAGTVRVTDFMYQSGDNPSVVRIVDGLEGSVSMRMQLTVRFDYGSVIPWVERLDHGITAVAGPDAVLMTTPVELRGENFQTVSDFTVNAGDRVPFSFIWYPSNHDEPEPLDAGEALNSSLASWGEWTCRCRYDGEWQKQVNVSLNVLKALTFDPTGAIAAAATTSLPEVIGGVRNWDYRYCWIRDASFTLYALMNCGYFEEAFKWRQWLHRAAAGHPSQLRIMYGLAGERRLTEIELDWLSGYEGAKPVRIGNAAAQQFQLDVYGELLDVSYIARRQKGAYHPKSWQLQAIILEHLASVWSKPDSGIWEVRGAERHFTHSKVMAWVAFDRGVKAVEQFDLPGPVERWRKIREEIHQQVCQNGFDSARNTFTQYYGSNELDASLLLIPLVGFLPVSDSRVLGTLEAIQQNLMHESLVYRYSPEGGQSIDGLPQGENAFLPCSFWFVDNLTMMGRTDEAREMFDHLLTLGNDLHLFSEEYDPVSKRMVGNFPQAFTHVALINSALNLSSVNKPCLHRSEASTDQE